MNRWFIFKRKRQETMAAAAVAEIPIASAPVAPNVIANIGRTASARSKANAIADAATAIQITNKRRGVKEGKVEENIHITPSRTVAVAPGPAADPETKKSYAIGEVFQFYTDASVAKDVLGLEDNGAARWLAPSAPFPIKDKDGDREIVYPTMEHYIGGMRAKLATNKPELAETIFSRE